MPNSRRTLKTIGVLTYGLYVAARRPTSALVGPTEYTRSAPFDNLMLEETVGDKGASTTDPPDNGGDAPGQPGDNGARQAARSAVGRPTLSLRAALALTAFSSLLFELTLTRILSVTLWYNYAFLIISLALMGFGLSGVLLATSQRVRSAGLPLLAAIYAVSIPVAYAVLNAIPFEPFSVARDSAQLLWAPVYLLTAMAPFIAAGLVIGSVFKEHPGEVGALYAWDLVGAAVGATSMVLLVPALGGPGAASVAGAGDRRHRRGRRLRSAGDVGRRGHAAAHHVE